MVGIVGLGSIGSKVAVSLARTGVRQFVLVDDDVVLPGNLCRNELDWTDVGQLKVEAVARAIRRVQAGVDVQPRRIQLTGQEATATVSGVIRQLAACDLIVDATACPRTFNLLARVASLREKTLIWCEVFEGGIGGLIARSRPKLDPSPFGIRKAWNKYAADNPYPKCPSTIPYGGDGDEPHVATDADVGVIAAHATQLALDVLLERAPSRFPHSMYLVGLAKGWVFEEPFWTIPIDAGPPDPTNGEEAAPPEVAAEVRSFVVQLLEGIERGPAAPS